MGVIFPDIVQAVALPPVDVVDVLKPSGDPHQAAEDIDEGAEDSAERADGAAVDLNPGVQLLLPGAGGPGVSQNRARTASRGAAGALTFCRSMASRRCRWPLLRAALLPGR